jgi:hypothetical protein
MTILSEETCPLNNCALVSMRDEYRDELGISVCYCPKCDAGFHLITVGPYTREPGERLQARLKWDRRRDQHELIRNDREVWSQFSAQIRQVWTASLHDLVAGFLADREAVAEKISCPCDASPIAVGQKSLASTPPWLFTWCGGCGGGFLFLFDETYGWERAADFRWDGTSSRCRFQRCYPTGGGHNLDWEKFEDKIRTPTWWS